MKCPRRGPLDWTPDPGLLSLFLEFVEALDCVWPTLQKWVTEVSFGVVRSNSSFGLTFCLLIHQLLEAAVCLGIQYIDGAAMGNYPHTTGLLFSHTPVDSGPREIPVPPTPKGSIGM